VGTRLVEFAGNFFSVLMRRSNENGCQYFGGTHCLHIQCCSSENGYRCESDAMCRKEKLLYVGPEIEGMRHQERSNTRPF
jgi:hypothetical protein